MRKKNILFQTRQNVFSKPGGDTTLLVKLKSGLEKFGFHVEFSHLSQYLGGFDLVHIFNLRGDFATGAAFQKKPFVVTPLFEDFGKYLVRSFILTNCFKRYLQNGVDREIREFNSRYRDATNNHYLRDVHFLLKGAFALFATGEEEKRTLEREIRGVAPIHIVKLGVDYRSWWMDVSPDLFVRKYGLRDFILCVGRLETRKNQLMLLYALRDDDYPIVFVNSRTGQPDYERLCFDFRRKGKVVFTGRLSREMLVSALKAAKVHALPSWYELPGLVTLDALSLGCNVVVSDYGTIRDYIGDTGFYCDPGDPASVRSAVKSAYHSDFKGDIGKLRGLTWEKYVEGTARVYEKILSMPKHKMMKRLERNFENAHKEDVYLRARENAEKLSKSDPEGCLKIVSKLTEMFGEDPHLYYLKGYCEMVLKRFEEAAESFGRSLELYPLSDVKNYLYRSLVLMSMEKFEEAHKVLNYYLEITPFMDNSLYELVNEYVEKAERGMREVV